MNADGSDQRNLTKNSPGWNLYPDWSPDGARIAYARSTSADAETDISVMDADGSDQTNLTHTSIRESEPVWSPDGRKIAFTRAPTIYPPDAIFVMNADGSGQRNLTNNLEDDYSAPSWSPDGKKIAFESDRTNYPRKEIPPFDIFVMNADGSGKTNLTKSAENDWNGGWKALPASAPPPPPSAQQRPCR
jgi:TolB protein